MKSAHYSSSAPTLPSSLPAVSSVPAWSYSPGYSPEPSRHSGLTSSSSASSSSASMGETAATGGMGTQACMAVSSSGSESSGVMMSHAAGMRAHPAHLAAAAVSTMRPVAPRHLPDELVALTFAYLDLPQLLTASQVNTQWKEVHSSDEFWHPLYLRWYGDHLRLNERRDWKFNFRARDLMLSKLAPSISLLAHPDRSHRVESVNFLRTHCELLRFVLPTESAVEDTPMAHQLAPHGMEAAVAAAAAAVHPTLASFYVTPPSIPPVLLRADRHPLPGAHTLELRHAQHIIKDALVNRGWRALFAHLMPPAADGPATATGYITAGAIQRAAASHAEVAFAATGAMDGTLGESQQTSCFPFANSTLNSQTPPGDAHDDDEAMADEGAAADRPSADASSSSSLGPSASAPLAAHLRLVEYGSVLVAWTECPWLSFDAVSAELDRIAQMVRERMESLAEERGLDTSAQLSFTDKLHSLHDVLYRRLSFRGNDVSYYDVRNSFVHFVLKARTGIPISMAIVYMAIAIRLGIHAEGVNSPGHFLLRVQERESEPTTATATPTPAAASSSSRASMVADGDVRMHTPPPAAHPTSPSPSSQPQVASAVVEGDSPPVAGASSSTGSRGGGSTYFIDAFSGQMMTPAMTLRFLSLVTQGDEDVDATAAAALQSQLRVCGPAALFVRMYRNLMNLYQNPAYHRNRIPTLANMDEAQASAYAHYEMDAYLHHCASQILELMRLSGEKTPDVLTSMFIERFRYAGGMS